MNMKIKRIFLVMLLCTLWLTGFAQKVIKGTVKDSSGEPLIGATVSLGGGQGTVTDMDGNFSLSNVNSNSVMTISYVGCKNQQVKVGNKTDFNVILQSTDKSLDEVVVIGYGTMKKRDLTGSVATINNEKLTQYPVADVSQALQGKLPGVSVTSQDGRPGANVSVRVRGGGSISQSNDPLFIVDGIPVSSISDIPAEQIETIDVLKDASSTAIYGARGANGVILVTTKGTKGVDKVKVSYSGYMQVKSAAKTPKGESAQDYVYDLWAYGTALSTVSGTFGEALAYSE